MTKTLITLLLVSSASLAQSGEVYRCGNTYQRAPCHQGDRPLALRVHYPAPPAGTARIQDIQAAITALVQLSTLHGQIVATGKSQ